MVSATTNFMASSAVSHARGKADTSPPPAAPPAPEARGSPSTPTTPRLKAAAAHQCSAALRVPLWRTGGLLFQFPQAHGTLKHLKMGSDDKSDRETKVEATWICTVYMEGARSHTEIGQLLAWSKWESGQLWTHPPWHLKGFRGKDTGFEKALYDFRSQAESWRNWTRAEHLLGAHGLAGAVDARGQELAREPTGAHGGACCWTGRHHVLFI